MWIWQDLNSLTLDLGCLNVKSPSHNLTWLASWKSHPQVSSNCCFCFRVLTCFNKNVLIFVKPFHPPPSKSLCHCCCDDARDFNCINCDVTNLEHFPGPFVKNARKNISGSRSIKLRFKTWIVSNKSWDRTVIVRDGTLFQQGQTCGLGEWIFSQISLLELVTKIRKMVRF